MFRAVRAQKWAEPQASMTISAGGRVARKEMNFERERRFLSETRPGTVEIEIWKKALARSTATS
jgi:hypothetical protein